MAVGTDILNTYHSLEALLATECLMVENLLKGGIGNQWITNLHGRDSTSFPFLLSLRVFSLVEISYF